MENISSKESNPFYIKKIQFKPGYSSMWRGFRSLLKTSLNISFRYQHQLTKYLLKFNKIIRNRLYYLFEMQLDNILTLSKFFPDRSWSNFFITEGAIFINGAKTKNYLEQVFVNDFIQLAVSCKYYITYRWLMTWQITKKNKFKYRLNKKWNVRHADDKQKSKNLPLWLLKNKNLNEDVPLYSEVDYFTLSCFIITEPFFFNDIDAISFLSKPFSIINLFNWKYIN
jgi:ribosomal 50S subunit-recycling heat shock protein